MVESTKSIMTSGFEFQFSILILSINSNAGASKGTNARRVKDGAIFRPRVPMEKSNNADTLNPSSLLVNKKRLFIGRNLYTVGDNDRMAYGVQVCRKRVSTVTVRWKLPWFQACKGLFNHHLSSQSLFQDCGTRRLGNLHLSPDPTLDTLVAIGYPHLTPWIQPTLTYA